MHKTVTGVIIRETNYSDSDKYISILTDSIGKIDILIKSARKKNNKFASVTSLFSYARFTIYENYGKYFLNEIDPIFSFFELTQDMEKYALACYMSQIIDVLASDTASHELLSSFLRGLYALNSQDRDISIIKAVFELKAMAICGYCPKIDRCHVCHKTADVVSPVFSINNGVLFCKACQSSHISGNVVTVTSNLANVIHYIINASPDKLFSFKLGDETLKSLAYLSEKYLLFHCDRRFKTLEFYNNIRG